MSSILAKGYLGITATLGLAAIAIAVFAMTVTTPINLGPLGVTGWFLLVLVGLSSLCALIAYLIIGRLQPSLSQHRQRIDASRRGLLLGGFLTTTLGLSSLEQLNVRDIILVAILLALVEFYVVARA